MFSFFKYFSIPEKNDIFDFSSDIDLAHLNWAENQPFSFDSHVAVIERRKVVIKLIHCITFPCTKSTILLQENWISLIIYWGTKA